MGPKKRTPVTRTPFRPPVKQFCAPFKTPAKEDSADADFNSLAETPKTPVVTPAEPNVNDLKTPNDTVPKKRTRKRKKDPDDFKTPAQPGRSTRSKAPKSDFDSLADTPSGTPARDNAEVITPVVGPPNTPATEEMPGPPTGRSKRRRTQTSFFGDVTNSEDVEHGTASKPTIKREMVDSDYQATSADLPEPNRKRVRRAQVKTERIYSYTQPLQVARTNEDLMIWEVAYIPGFQTTRCWDGDGVGMWVKPPPLLILTQQTYTEEEIEESRHFSPGPPVCPLVIRRVCHGRYPPDNMSVRIAMQMRRSWCCLVLRQRTTFVDAVSRTALYLRALRLGHVEHTELNQLIGFKKICKILYWKRGTWDVMKCMECIQGLTEIYISKDTFPKYAPAVNVLFEKVRCEVLKALKMVMLSPRAHQQLSRLGIQAGRGRGRDKSHVIMSPGQFVPFLTDREYEQKWRSLPPKHTDEELTREYDRVGNVVGHFTVPNLRELLAPISIQELGTCKNSRKITRMYYKMYPEERRKVIKEKEIPIMLTEDNVNPPNIIMLTQDNPPNDEMLTEENLHKLKGHLEPAIISESNYENAFKTDE